MTTISLPPKKIEKKNPKKFWSLVIPDDKIDPCVFFQTRRTSNTGFFLSKKCDVIGDLFVEFGRMSWFLIAYNVSRLSNRSELLRKGSWINWCSVWHSQYWIALAYVTWLTDIYIYIYPIILFCHLKNIG